MKPSRSPKARRRFASIVLPTGATLLAAGALLLQGSEFVHTLGVIAVGYSIGMIVIGVWISLGGGPPPRE